MNRQSPLFYFLLLMSYFASGQINTYSPYSYFGLGDLYGNGSAVYNSMGGLGTGVLNNNHVNFINPASYSFLHQTSFEFGVKTSFLNMQEMDLEQNNIVSTLSHLSLGFPIAEKLGFAVSLLPYSSVGYQLSTTENILVNMGDMKESIETRSDYYGSGGINNMTFGLAWKIQPSISIGLNLNYLFGTIERETVLFTSNSPNYFRNKIDKIIRGINLDFGVLYHKDAPIICQDCNLNVGFNFTPKKDISSTEQRIQSTYLGPIFDNNNSETINEERVSEDVTLPLSFSTGFSLGVKDKWLIGLDYDYTRWKSINNSPYLSNNNEIRIGGYYIPNKSDIYKYLNRIEYRFGLSYNNGYLDAGIINGMNNSSNSIQELAFHCGMGLPMNKVSSMANIGFKYGLSGISLDANYIKERYFTIYFSMTLNEKWFNKRKIE